MVVLIYISLIAKDVEHLFTCLLFIQVVWPSVVQTFAYFFFPFAQLSVRFFIFLCCKNYFHILDTSSSLVIFSSNLCLASSVA